MNEHMVHHKGPSIQEICFTTTIILHGHITSIPINKVPLLACPIDSMIELSLNERKAVATVDQSLVTVF